MESEWWVMGWLLGEPVSGHFDMLSKQTCCDTKSRNGRKIFAPLGRMEEGSRQDSKVRYLGGREGGLSLSLERAGLARK